MEPLDPFSQSPVVESFVRRWIRVPPAFEGRIHPEDEMYRYGLESLRGASECAAVLYYLKGYQIVTAIRGALAALPEEIAGVPSLLDFASGFGRSTRYLVRELAPSRIWVAELQPGATAFQQEVFGVYASEATPEPDGFEPGRRFACVVASSLFSHLPPALFEGWLGRLHSLVDQGGLLLFSVHGGALAPAGTDLSEGIAFTPFSESRTLSPEQYGTTHVTPRFVEEAVRRVTGAGAGFAYYPYGLCAQQDLCVVSPSGAIIPADLPLFPRGDLLAVATEGERLLLRGWVSSPRRHGGDVTVTLSVGAERRDYRVLPEAEAADTDRADWELSTERGAVAPDEVVAVSAVTSRGLENILAMGTLRTAALVPPEGRRSRTTLGAGPPAGGGSEGSRDPSRASRPSASPGTSGSPPGAGLA